MIRRYPVTSFFVLTFGITWPAWFAAARLPSAALPLVLLGVFGPTLAALACTARCEGRPGVRRLLRTVLKWRVKPGWYLFAALGPVALAFVAIAVYILLGGEAPTIGTFAEQFGLSERPGVFLALFPLFLLMGVISGGPIGEELGWRGYAQPQLQRRIGAARASVVIGLIWGFWHLPFYLISAEAVQSTSDYPLLLFIPLVTAFGVMFGLLYNRTKGSVLLCILFHGGFELVSILGLLVYADDRGLLTVFVVLAGAVAASMYVQMLGVRSSVASR